MKKIAALTLFVLLTAAAEPPVLNGTYKFETRARDSAANRPVCTETWTFDGKNQMTVISGQEVVEETYRTEIDRDGTWLVTRRLKTNGLQDCMGNRSSEVSSSDNRIYLMRFNSGDMMTCSPPTHTEDGTPFVSNDSCYGTLTPKKQT